MAAETASDRRDVVPPRLLLATPPQPDAPPLAPHSAAFLRVCTPGKLRVTRNNQRQCASSPRVCSPTAHPPFPHPPQLAHLSLDGLASGEGLSALSHLTTLAISPAQGARIRLHGLPRLQRLVCDLGSSGSSGRELLGERASVHVPAAGHGLASLAHLELRCFVWRHWEAGASADGSDGVGSDAGGSEDGGDNASEEEDADAGSGAGSEAGSDGSDGSGEGEDAASSGGGSGSEAGSSEAGSEVADEMALDGWEAAEEEEAGEGQGGGPAADEEEEEEEAAGLLEASWGFMQQGPGSSAGGEGQGVPAIVSLEQR